MRFFKLTNYINFIKKYLKITSYILKCYKEFLRIRKFNQIIFIYNYDVEPLTIGDFIIFLQIVDLCHIKKKKIFVIKRQLREKSKKMSIKDFNYIKKNHQHLARHILKRDIKISFINHKILNKLLFQKNIFFYNLIKKGKSLTNFNEFFLLFFSKKRKINFIKKKFPYHKKIKTKLHNQKFITLFARKLNRDHQRNTDPNQLKKIIDLLTYKYPTIKIVIISDLEFYKKFSKKFSHLKNIIFSKKYNTSFLNDCNLICDSALNISFFVGGINQIALMTKKPYIIFSQSNYLDYKFFNFPFWKNKNQIHINSSNINYFLDTLKKFNYEIIN